MIKSACDLQTVKSGKKRSLGVPANNFLFARRVPANNFLFAGRVPANNFLFAGRVLANNFLFAGRIPANNLFLYFDRAYQIHCRLKEKTLTIVAPQAD